jgi:hypothetical protein
MAGLKISTKRLQIDRANAVMVATIAIGSFLTVFSLMATKALISTQKYQAKVIKAKEETRETLKANIKEVNTLVNSYQAFVSAPQNVLKGDPSKVDEPNGGDNARLVLDSLPSKYDFPALATSIEKILADGQYDIEGIVGNDEEVTQGAVTAAASPAPIEMPFQFSAKVTEDIPDRPQDNQTLSSLLTRLERSIRPIQVTLLDIDTDESNVIRVSITAKSFFQPEKTLNISEKEIK